MVILQFNKLIRNKWVWGAFAVVVSAAFCFDDMFTSGDRGDSGEAVGNAGTLNGKAVDAKLFQTLAEDIRGRGGNRDWNRKDSEINRAAWETYAALTVAEKNGIDATDEEVKGNIRYIPAFQVQGQFNFDMYQRVLREHQMSPESFEASLKRSATMEHIGQRVLASAAWVSPMELDQAVADRTDVFTVRVARFVQDGKAAAAVKLDDAGLRKWYDANTNSLALPERIKIRFVKFDATQKAILAKMDVTEEEIHNRFDDTSEKYVIKGTNGTETAKRYDQLTKAEKDGIEADLRRIAAVQFYETNLNFRVFGKEAAKGASRLDEIAKEDGLKVETSDWFSIDGGYQEGFMKRMGMILPGAQDFAEKVAELDPVSESSRYAVITSERAVWIAEKVATSPKHVPTFDEAKDIIKPRALRDAKADAFKAEVEGIAKQGAKAVLASKNVSTNITFAVCDLIQNYQQPQFEDQMAVARAAMSLSKGEVSKFTLTMPGCALLVVCEDRVQGDAAKAMMLKRQVAAELAMPQTRQLSDAWRKWNLERLTFEPGEISFVADAADGE